MEYFQHLLEVMSRADRAAKDRLNAAAPPIATAFDMALEDRVQCGSTHAVSYKRERTNTWSLGIPVEAATNQQELEAFQVISRPTFHRQQASWKILLGISDIFCPMLCFCLRLT